MGSLTNSLLKKNFKPYFCGWSSIASRLQCHYVEVVYFLPLSSQKFRPQKDERLNRPWSHPVGLNMGPLDWESSVVTTRALLHHSSLEPFWPLGLWHNNDPLLPKNHPTGKLPCWVPTLCFSNCKYNKTSLWEHAANVSLWFHRNAMFITNLSI